MLGIILEQKWAKKFREFLKIKLILGILGNSREQEH